MPNKLIKKDLIKNHKKQIHKLFAAKLFLDCGL